MRLLKRLLLTSFCILPAVFASCAGNAGVISDAPVKAIVEDIVSDYTSGDGFLFSADATEEGEYLDEDLISTYYGNGEKVPDFSEVGDYCVYIDETNAREMCEVGLFRMKSGADKQDFESYLKNRIAIRLSNAKSYPDINKSSLKAAKFGIVGDYVYYAVVKDASADIGRRIDLLLHGGNPEA